MDETRLMDETRQRLAKCFQTVFPSLKTPESATRASLAEWDSIAEVTLLQVVSEEFDVPLDYEDLAAMSSFDLVLKHVSNLRKVS